MPLSRDKFDALVQRLEAFAEQRPRAYVTRVAMLAGFGYLILLLILFVMAACLVPIIWLLIKAPNAATLKLVFVGTAIFGGLGFAVVRSLWVRLEPPKGIELKQVDAPELFGFLEHLRRQFRTRRFHHVLLTNDFNASVVQIPRLGILGFNCNYLTLGLPLMLTLSEAEMRAVLAHEMVHLSRNHGRFGAWIYRVRQTWARLLEELFRHSRSGMNLFLKFFNWYSPYFNAYSFVLARRNEYEADRWAAHFTSAPDLARALVRLQVGGRYLGERFWPNIFDQVKSLERPPQGVFADAAVRLHDLKDVDQGPRWLHQALLIQTNTSDTHPCLTERLANLGLPAVNAERAFATLAEHRGAPAAEAFFGDRLPVFREKVEDQWRKSITFSWRQRFRECQELSKQLQQLLAKPDDPTEAELWQRAHLTMDLKGDDSAMPLLRQLLEKSPSHPGANYAVGRILLDKDDVAGLPHVERAMQADFQAVHPGCELLYGFYQRAGQRERLRAILERYDKHSEELHLAQIERANINAKDVLIPHELSAPILAQVVEKLTADPEVAVAWLARKQLKHFPENHCYLLLLKARQKWYTLRASDADQKLINRFLNVLPLPGQVFLFTEGSNLAALAKKVRNVPGSVIVSGIRG